MAKKKLPELNNDTQEKQQRRQSMLVDKRRRTSVFGIPPQLTAKPAETQQVQVNNLRRLSVVNPDALDETWKQSISQEELHQNYETWMKIAADNVFIIALAARAPLIRSLISMVEN